MAWPLYYLDITVMWKFFNNFPYSPNNDFVLYSEFRKLLKEQNHFKDLLNDPENNIEMMFGLNDTFFKTSDGRFNIFNFKALCLVICRGETETKV